MPVRPEHFHICSARPAFSRTRPFGSRSQARPPVLSRGPGRAPSRQHAWTCILVAFLWLPAGLLKVPLSLNDPCSPVVWAAHRCFSVRLFGPGRIKNEAAGNREKSRDSKTNKLTCRELRSPAQIFSVMLDVVRGGLVESASTFPADESCTQGTGSGSTQQALDEEAANSRHCQPEHAVARVVETAESSIARAIVSWAGWRHGAEDSFLH